MGMLKTDRSDYNDHFMSDVIPDDEPVFVIRAQDVVSGDAVRAWADLAEKAGASEKMVAMARNHARLMDQWPKKKVPDLPSGC
jgi:DNA-binding phage protein